MLYFVIIIQATREKLEAKISEIEKELELTRQTVTTNGELSSLDIVTGDNNKSAENETFESKNSSACPVESEINILRGKNKQLLEESNLLSSKISMLEKEKLDVQAVIERLQESNSEHLHQIATLQSDLANTECIKVQLQKYVTKQIHMKTKVETVIMI